MVKYKHILGIAAVALATFAGGAYLTRTPKIKPVEVEKTRGEIGLDYSIKLENGESYRFLRQNDGALENSMDLMNQDIQVIERIRNEAIDRIRNSSDEKLRNVNSSYDDLRRRLRENL